jgi:hypothetical protein
MLEGIAGNPIIAGAYATDDGVCPMLAAHRAGGRTSLIAFARAWDRFAFRDARRARARRATERELRVLTAQLELSLLEDEVSETGLAAARHEHLALTRRRLGDDERREARERRRRRVPVGVHQPSQHRLRPGDPDRSVELGRRSGWSWTRLFRRYDEYEQALQRLEAETLRAGGDPDTGTPAPDALLTRGV